MSETSIVDNTSGQGSTAIFYRGLVENRCDDDLGGGTLSLGYIQLHSLFLRTLGLGWFDIFRKSLTWQHYRGALQLRDKPERHGQYHTLTCTIACWTVQLASYDSVAIKSLGSGLYLTVISFCNCLIVMFIIRSSFDFKIHCKILLHNLLWFDC